MTLGAAMWNASQAFYDNLTLERYGDPTEQYAATSLNLASRFPHYEQFWRYHVCPSTERPSAIVFRPGVADIISVVTQRNYTVFVYLVEALEYQRLVDARDFGPRYRNCYAALMYAGNALQVFAEFQTALCGKPNAMGGVCDLAKQLGVTINPFPDWQATWKYDRDLLSTYRNYLTHQGWFYTVFKSATQELLVLKPDEFIPGDVYTWTHADRDYANDQSRWIPIQELCRLVVDDTIAFLDLAYEKICVELRPLLLLASYQSLWGWQPHQAIPVNPPPTSLRPSSPPSTGVGYSIGVMQSMTGKTSGGVDNNPAGGEVATV